MPPVDPSAQESEEGSYPLPAEDDKPVASWKIL